MNRPLRILAIGHSYVVAMNRAIARRVGGDKDFDITIAAPAYFRGDLRPLKLEPEPSNSPILVVPLNTHVSQFIHLFRYDQHALTKLITTGNFDVVDAWEEPYILAGYQIANTLKNTNARFGFLTAQNYVKSYPPPFGFFERKVLARAQGWVAAASLVYEAMLKREYPSQCGKILNHAVDTEAFQVSSSDQRQQVIEEIGIPTPIIGFVGRLTLDKGIGVLMNAMDQLLNQPWGLLFLGSGESRPLIEQWAHRREITDRVKIILAKHDEVPRYLGAMDLLVAPSQTAKNWREQFGRMIIEAFACGVPVVGSDSGEIPHVVGDAGCIIAESDAGAWARCIAGLLNDVNARRRMVKLGLERAKEFSVESSAERYKAYYRWLSERPLN